MDSFNLLNSLTVVVPVGLSNMNVHNLNTWANQLDLYPVIKEVIVVLDKQVENNFNSNRIRQEIYNSKKIKWIEGNYNSPGLARNVGKNFVNSKFVVFWDSDDIPNLNNLEEVMIVSSKNQFDLAVTKYTRTNKLSGKEKEMGNSTREILMNPGIWRVIFKMEFIRNLEFGISKMGEDQVFLARCLAKNPKIIRVNLNLYNYIIGNQFQLTKNWDAISTLNVSRRDVGKILKKNSRWYFAIFLIYTRLFLTEKKFLLKACLRNTNVEMSKNEK